MNQRERMMAGLPYKAWLDGLDEERHANACRIHEFNLLHPDAHERRKDLLGEILGKAGADVHFNQPFHCDYGKNIKIGDYFFANFNCVILDVGEVVIGDGVMFGPNVSLYTAGHPLHPVSRSSGYEYGIPITIGNNVWIGGNAVVMPGVTIGDNCVIGAGSVVTKDIPANSAAAGNPCRVLREITEEDRRYYYKDKEFDDESWQEICEYANEQE